MTFSLPIRSLAALVLISLCLPSGTLAQESSQEYYEHAQQLMFSREYRSALIQLKNALQKDPEHVPSLLLLGDLQLQLKRPAAAEASLLKARVLGADRTLINLKLAKAYLDQAEYREVINNVSSRGLAINDQAELLGYQARAYLGLNKPARAAQKIGEALSLTDNGLQPAIAQITLARRSGDLKGALREAVSLTDRHSRSAEAWNQRASVEHTSGYLEKAIDNYDQALAIEPDHLEARAAKVGILTDLSRFESAMIDLKYLEQRFPYDPKAAYFRALGYNHFAENPPSVDLLKQLEIDEAENPDWLAKADLELQKCTTVISKLPEKRVAADRQLTMVAALAHFSLEEYESTRQYLEQYLKQGSTNLGANRLFIKTLIKLDEPKKAIQKIAPVLDAHPKDAALQQLLVDAYTKAELYDRATRLLERMRKEAPEDRNIELQLALSHLRSGSRDRGLTSLMGIFKRDPENAKVGYLLAASLLKANRNAESLKITEQLLNQQPDFASYLNLRGIALRNLGKLDKAAANFEQVLKSDPESVEAGINLAKIERDRGHIDQSRQRLAALAAANPDNPLIPLAQARLEHQQDNLDQALKLSEHARQLDDRQLEVMVLLVQLYLEKEDFKNAELIAIEAANSHRTDYEAQVLLPTVMTAAGRTRQAISQYKRMVKEAGFKTETLYPLAQRLRAVEAYTTARHALFKAIEGTPNHLPSLVAYIEIEIQLREYPNALKRSIQLTEEYPKHPAGYQLAGEALMLLLRPDEAERYFSLGLAREFQPSLAVGKYQALMAQGKTANATKHIESQWRRHPESTVIGAAYSEALIQNTRWKEARETLGLLLERSPKDPDLLNNMAYVASQLNQEDALQYARAALSAAPNNPFVNDTLGWILVKQGQATEGLRYLREAAARLSGHPEIHYHLAQALNDLQRYDEALSQVEVALNHANGFQNRQAAEKLHRRLKLLKR
ncbi:PEP-CTERM system TPR-repeat protein PrsT [Pseudomaricurvus alkylphenolicus]|uniref:XrtA/PEP-CTERM system TPR-repeat protein PrsT n=1 Tax=Pseudomaricurvus alkylphenolicus TaxID=1306991 RepID=UPI0014214DB3|nr:XrtA/PEP-CTERM system TPR-repeat protein PrsT [Pseudomaricurvus alkylphenolicus]NIB43144.1 PEP-CTERM system TPR-repeat protein PrsT [Pseudomaricurvus alkylphenolicus]